MKKKKLTIFDAGVAFVMSFILAQITSIIGILLTKYVLIGFGKSNSQIESFFNTAPGYLLQALFMNVAFIFVFVWYIRRVDKREVVNKPNKSTLKYVFACIGLGIATLFLVSGVLNYFQLFIEKLGFKTSTLPYELNSTYSYIISLISLAVIPAVCEELIFRGILVNALKSKGQIFAIPLSSIMFSIFHFSPSQLIYPICFGLILSIVYLRTNNILFPMLLHFINNALSLSIQYFSNSTGAFSHSASTLIYAIITFVVWILIMIRLFNDFKSKCLTQPTETNLKKNKPTHISNEYDKNNNDKLNNYVLYGSIIIMLCIYILLNI